MTQVIYFTDPAEIEQFAHSYSLGITNVGVQCQFCRMPQYTEMAMSAPETDFTCQFCGELTPVGVIIPSPSKDFWMGNGFGLRIHLN